MEQEEVEIGKITHYFPKIGVAVVELSKSLSVGDKIHIRGNVTDFEQGILSMQIEHAPVQTASKEQSIGLKVDDIVREGDLVFLVKT